MTTNRRARGSRDTERPAQSEQDSTQTDLRAFGFTPASQLRFDQLGERDER